MGRTIAVAGKGGTGKTTVATLLIQHLIEHRSGTILAIDADPSTNLHLVLGVPLEETIGDIREKTLQEIGRGGLGGISKHDYLEVRINRALVESERFDLLATGHSDGPGCYCAANHLLRFCIDGLAKSYDYVVIDNEAGLEHLSRRTTRDVDLLLIVSDPTIRGLIAASRVVDLIRELDTHASHIHLIMNRVSVDGDGRPTLAPQLESVIKEKGLELVGLIPEDSTVADYDALGKPLIDLSKESLIRSAMEDLLQPLDGLL
ncbi:MAG: AAA family ATPase [Anaerolineae bacterium]